MNFNLFKKSAVAAGLASLSAVAMSSGASAACTGNTEPTLVKNGSFESGSGATITDWTVAFNGGIGISTSEKRSGAQSVYFSSVGGENRLSQTISGTTAGDSYTVCFYLISDSDRGPSSFRAQWNNQDMIALKNVPDGGSTFTYYSFSVVATGNDVLSFEGRHDPAEYYLDNVYVQQCDDCSIPNEVVRRKTPPSQFAPFKKQ